MCSPIVYPRTTNGRSRVPTEYELKLIAALRSTNTLCEDIATALEGHGDIALRDDLLKRVRENEAVIRELNP
jgi:hypothetical protein